MKTLQATIALCLALGSAPAMAGPREDGDAALKRGDYAAALKILRPLAEQGHPDAQVLIAQLYARGLGTTQDFASAQTWLRHAAERGSPEAYLMIGDLYVNGLGVRQDFAIAYRWYGIVAELAQGDVKAEALKLRDAVGAKLTKAAREEAQDNIMSQKIMVTSLQIAPDFMPSFGAPGAAKYPGELRECLAIVETAVAITGQSATRNPAIMSYKEKDSLDFLNRLAKVRCTQSGFVEGAQLAQALWNIDTDKSCSGIISDTNQKPEALNKCLAALGPERKALTTGYDGAKSAYQASSH